MKYLNIITLVSILSLIGCRNNSTNVDYLEFRSTKFELNFLNVDEFKNNDWIEIDNVKFIHLENKEDLNKIRWSLPASNVYYVAERSNRYEGLSVGIDLGNYLTGINRNLKTEEHNYTYEIINVSHLLAFGKLTFMRTDSLEINIKTSPNYPIEILKLD